MSLGFLFYLFIKSFFFHYLSGIWHFGIQNFSLFLAKTIKNNIFFFLHTRVLYMCVVQLSLMLKSTCSLLWSTLVYPILSNEIFIDCFLSLSEYTHVALAFLSDCSGSLHGFVQCPRWTRWPWRRKQCIALLPIHTAQRWIWHWNDSPVWANGEAQAFLCHK